MTFWLILACYLLGAVALTARLWADPGGRAQVGDTHDVDQFAWFLRYAATAVSHGRLPALFTTALDPPRGVNLMWNTSFLVPGMLLAPVTLLAGPQVSLTLVLTLGFAGSAASLCWVLRRWGASLTAAALGGAVYGFSPALLDSGIGHYNLQFAVLPPLIIHALLRILTGRGGRGGDHVGGRRDAARAGIWLGLLVSAQLFISSELLTDTALAGLVLVTVLAAGHPRAAARRAAPAAVGLGTSAAVALLLCGHALLVQFRGPLTEHYQLPGPWSGNLAFFVSPAGNLLFHTSASAAFNAAFPLGPAEILAYLGWPLLAVLVAAAVRFWRDPKVRAAAVTWVTAELLSLGGGNLPLPHGLSVPAPWLPYHWLQGLPVVGELLPNRFSIIADGAAAAVLAFSLDLARSSVPLTWARWRRGIPTAVAVLAILPLIPRPYQAAPVTPVPAGWQDAFARLRLPADAPVLVAPIPDVLHTQAMRWQAETGQPGSMVGGYFLAPGPNGQPEFGSGANWWATGYLYTLWTSGQRAGAPSASSLARLRAHLAYWRVAAVVAVTGETSALGRVLIDLLGRPTFRVGSVLAWRR